jgi:hypothetical protein
VRWAVTDHYRSRFANLPPTKTDVSLRLIVGTLVVSSALALSGCGGTGQTVTKTVAAPQQITTQSDASGSFTAPASDVPTSCTVYWSDNAARINFQSTSVNVQSACQTWIKSSAQNGELWTETVPTGALIGTPSLVCELEDSGGQISAVVSDSGSQSEGQSDCSSLISNGWTESGH